MSSRYGLVLRILVVGPSWVGDTVLAQPLFARLRERHADLELEVLSPAWTLPLLKRMPQVDTVLLSPFGHGALALAERWRLARRLRERGYARAIVLPNSFKSALIPWLASIPARTGYVGEARQLLLNDARRLDRRALPLLAERYAALGDPPGAPLTRPLPRPALASDPQARAALLAKLQLDPAIPAAAFCPGAEYGPAKRWLPEHFARLAERMSADGFQIWMIGSQNDRALADRIVCLSQASCSNLCGSTSLEEAVDLLAAAHVVVSNDSGLMHVAAALDRPLAALYGSSSPSFTPPLSTRAEIIRLDLPCSPCFARECPLGHFDCMTKLTPERVHERVARLAKAG